jgi:hypothetical protein
VLSGRGLCDRLITRPEESYRLWRVVVCDQVTSKDVEAKAHYRAVKIQPQWVVTPGKQTNSNKHKHNTEKKSLLWEECVFIISLLHHILMNTQIFAVVKRLPN